MVHTCYLARTHIQSMHIYINEKKLPLSAIVEQEAPDLAITGNFYGPGWVPVCPLKADGRVLEYDPEYAYPALCWDEGPDVGVEIVPKGGMSPQLNYIANCAGIYAGQDQPMFYGSDVGGRRGRAVLQKRFLHDSDPSARHGFQHTDKEIPVLEAGSHGFVIPAGLLHASRRKTCVAGQALRARKSGSRPPHGRTTASSTPKVLIHDDAATSESCSASSRRTCSR